MIVGDSNTGKFRLAVRFIRDDYKESSQSFSSKSELQAIWDEISTLNDAPMRFEIWDTDNVSKFKGLSTVFRKGTAAAIVVYDITNEKSFFSAKKWVVELQRRAEKGKILD